MAAGIPSVGTSQPDTFIEGISDERLGISAPNPAFRHGMIITGISENTASVQGSVWV